MTIKFLSIGIGVIILCAITFKFVFNRTTNNISASSKGNGSKAQAANTIINSKDDSK